MPSASTSYCSATGAGAETAPISWRKTRSARDSRSASRMRSSTGRRRRAWNPWWAFSVSTRIQGIVPAAGASVMRLRYTRSAELDALVIPTGVLVGAVAATIGFFILLIWSMKRHRDPKLTVDCDSSIEDLMPSLSGLTLGTVVEGNSVEMLVDGAYFDALVEEIRAA